MNRNRVVFPVRYIDYISIFKAAQEFHERLNEPIPNLREDSEPKIKSSLVTPFQGYEGKFFYKGFNEKATMLFYFLLNNHCLGNGNKRLAILSLAFFCLINNKSFKFSQEHIYSLAKNILLGDGNVRNKTKTINKIRKEIRSKIHDKGGIGLVEIIKRKRRQERIKNKKIRIITNSCYNKKIQRYLSGIK